MFDEDFLYEETFRDRVSTVTAEGKRKWIYATKPAGKWFNSRRILAYLFLAVFFLLPFIYIDGMPFFMINILEGKFILFSKIFWPQDFFIFAIGMITFIVFIILFTVIYGRLFCGWVCPQTVFLEFVFRPIEWLIEGSPSQQQKLNASNGTDKLIKKSLKHAIYFLISFLIAHTFLAYILGLHEVVKLMREPVSEHIGLFSGLLIFTLLFYGVFAFVREIVCTTICPYGRLQSVMFDKNTMQIAYDYNRGEPRGKFKKNVARTDGDCINCFKCVRVCPTGIDIRDGLQMECVGCAACIDACNEVMDAVGLKKGLIRFASENEISTGVPFKINRRIIAYSSLLAIMMVFLGVLIATRSNIDTNISKVKGQLYQELPNGEISNLYEAKIINKSKKERTVQLALQQTFGSIKVVGQSEQLILKPEAINVFTFFIELPKEKLTKRTNKLVVAVKDGNEVLDEVSTKFLAPF